MSTVLRTVMVSRFSLSRQQRNSKNVDEVMVRKSPTARKNKFNFRVRTNADAAVTAVADDDTIPPTPTQQQTRVVPMTMQQQQQQYPPQPKIQQQQQQQRDEAAEDKAVVQAFSSIPTTHRLFACGSFCGAGRQAQRLLEYEETTTTEWTAARTLPEDPSVQESIECIVAATHGDLIDLLKRSDDDYLPTPSSLQQSMLKNRSFRNSQYPQRRRREEEAEYGVPTTSSFEKQQQQTCCGCCAGRPPAALPKDWPQRPLLLRPTPESGTRVKGIRFVDSADYLWTPESPTSWPQALQRHWGKTTLDDEDETTSQCSQCVILPLNNGQEPEGETLVTDFESPVFDGTLLVRIRDSQGTTDPQTELKEGYFHGLNRRYQVVVRGKFKTTVPLTECMTGFQLDRPAGKLPAKWMVNGALNVVRFFAPQLQTCIDSNRPYSLSPLGSTPQALIVGDTSTNLAHSQQEPTHPQHTLLGQASDAPTSLQRAKLRKKQFDKLFSNKSPTPVTNNNTVYTFEFLQHLFHFQDFCIELGSFLGTVPLAPLLDGQAMQIMANTSHQKLWSFDIWHECLLNDAERHYQKQKGG